MNKGYALLLAAAVLAVAVSPVSGQAPGYHIVESYPLGGSGSWDYLALDTAGHRLFIARQNRMMVVDLKGKLLGEIDGLKGAHGVAFSYDNNRGFATEGSSATVAMFDLAPFRSYHILRPMTPMPSCSIHRPSVCSR